VTPPIDRGAEIRCYILVDQDCLKKHLTTAILLELRQPYWSYKAGRFWTRDYVLVVMRYRTEIPLGWFVLREGKRLAHPDGRLAIFRRFGEAQRAAVLHASDSLGGGVPFWGGLGWKGS
jgi:hypothetical protein